MAKFIEVKDEDGECTLINVEMVSHVVHIIDGNCNITMSNGEIVSAYEYEAIVNSLKSAASGT